MIVQMEMATRRKMEALRSTHDQQREQLLK
jgi:hypothetical protein